MWLDATADRSDAAHRKGLKTLGGVLALSITNACYLPIELPDLFFRWLLFGGGGGTGAGGKNGGQPPFMPSVEVRAGMDEAPLRQIRPVIFSPKNILRSRY